jgi:hypothetical protein
MTSFTFIISRQRRLHIQMSMGWRNVTEEVEAQVNTTINRYY